MYGIELTLALWSHYGLSYINKSFSNYRGKSVTAVELTENVQGFRYEKKS